MDILFFADNRTRHNWGCRATSIALKDLIREKHNIMYTIYGDITFSYYPYLMFPRKTFCTKLYSAIYNRSSLCRKLSKLIDPINIIRSSVSESYNLYQKALKYNSILKDIDDKVRKVDALVVNAEGSFIFSTPERYDTILYLLILKVAQNYGKKTYCLNAMFSDSPASICNDKILYEAKDILSMCTLVTARDPLSLMYYKKNISKEIKYVPDALFTWTKYVKYENVIYDYPLSLIPFPEMDNMWSDFDFSESYICLSGSSLAARNSVNAKHAYKKLALELKKISKLIIILTCDGDSFLKDIAEEIGCLYVPVNINIVAGMSILLKAKAFVSGRWHPSILASISGTPCVFLGSNSHKTMAIQKMIEYNDQKEYNSIPSNNEIKCIVNDVSNCLLQGEKLRNSIRDKSMQLSLESISGNNL